MKFREENNKKISINLTPLIDVLFLLLIFFMLSTTFDRFSGMQLELPSSHQKTEKENKTIDVSLDKNGKIFFNKSEVKLEELSKLFNEANKNGNIPLVLRADRSVPHGLVVEVMDIAKENRINKIAIATKSVREN